MNKQQRDELCEENWKLAEKLTNKYAEIFYSLDRDEIKSIAYMALFIASRNYKPEKGAKFVTYAHKCIECQILRLASENRVNTILVSYDKDLIRVLHADNMIDKTEDRIYAEHLLSYVSPEEQQILRKYYFEGYFMWEIAEENNWCYQNVQRIIRKAQKNIKKAAL